MKIDSVSKCVKLIFFLIYVSFFIFSCSTNRNTKGHPGNISDLDERDRVIGEYIITIKNYIVRDSLYDLFASYDLIKIENIKDNVLLIKLEIDPGIETMRSEFLGKKGISDIQPNYIYSIDPPKKRRIKIEPE